jgi:hypothetical protein
MMHCGEHDGTITGLVDCLALSISSDFWLCWLVYEAWHGIRAQGLEFETWLS